MSEVDKERYERLINEHLKSIFSTKICPFVNGMCTGDKCMYHFKYKQTPESNIIIGSCEILDHIRQRE